jgi:hypothetical protein
MSDKDAVIREVMAGLEREPKIDVHHYPISLDFDSGILTLGRSGERHRRKETCARARCRRGVCHWNSRPVKGCCCRNGLVSTETESEVAEHDAWYVFGFNRVVNNLEVQY